MARARSAFALIRLSHRLENHDRVCDGSIASWVQIRVPLVAAEHDDVARLDAIRVARRDELDQSDLASQVLARARRVGNADQPLSGWNRDAFHQHAWNGVR